MGPHATDLIAEATLAINNGLTSEQLAKTIHAHPTLAETLMEAAEGVHGMSIHV
jgi:dihydrolipoamide dehydrogenase